MKIPSVQIGKVVGDKLTVKAAGGEFSAPLTELHDAWWNSIAERCDGVISRHRYQLFQEERKPGLLRLGLFEGVAKGFAIHSNSG